MSNVHFYIAAYQIYCFVKLVANCLLILAVLIHLLRHDKKQSKTKKFILSGVIVNLLLDSVFDVIFAYEVYNNCSTILQLINGWATVIDIVAGMLAGTTILQPLKSI